MLKVLVPVHGTHNCELAVKHVIHQFMNHAVEEIHLLNVQAPFNGDITQFSSKKSQRDYHREQSDKELAPFMRLLDECNLPYSVHAKVGDCAKTIVDVAHHLHCDQIVMGTTRKNALTRLVENSVVDKVIELTSVPVEVIAGDQMSKWERYGIPAGIAAAAAAIGFAALE